MRTPPKQFAASALHVQSCRAQRYALMDRRSKAQPKKGQGRNRLTHFLCLPLATAQSTAQLQDAFKVFRNSVTATDNVLPGPALPESSSSGDAVGVGSPRIHAQAIRPVNTLHCTLGVMSLDAERLEQAIDLLKSLDLPALLESALGTSLHQSGVVGADAAPNARKQSAPKSSRRPISIRLRGLESMHSPHQTSVLYCSPSDETSRLYPFCQRLIERFTASGLLVLENRPLKLHATIVNNIYAKEGTSTGSRHPSAVQPASLAAANSGSRQNLAGNEGVEQGDNPKIRNAKSRRPLKMDARRLLEEYKSFVWADSIVLDRVSICEMGAKKIRNTQGEVIDERYVEIASVPLPQQGL